MTFYKLIIYHKVSRIYRHLKQDFLVNIYGFTFFLYDKMEARVLRIPQSVDRIKVWSDIIIELSFFFNGASLFLARVT